MKQLQAGYIIDGIAEYLTRTFSKEKVERLRKLREEFENIVTGIIPLF